MSLIMDCRCKMHHALCVCRLQLSLLLRMVRPSRGWHTSALHLFLDGCRNCSLRIGLALGLQDYMSWTRSAATRHKYM